MLYIPKDDLDFLTDQVITASKSLVDGNGIKVRTDVNRETHGRLIQHMLKSTLGLACESLVEDQGTYHLQGNGGRKPGPVDIAGQSAPAAVQP